jgi:hypothetical protein
MSYMDWPESMRPLHGPMRLEQLSEVMRRQTNEAHERASAWGMKDTAAGCYSAWLWCELGLVGEPRGELNWLGRQRIQAAQDCVPLDDEVGA